MDRTTGLTWVKKLSPTPRPDDCPHPQTVPSEVAAIVWLCDGPTDTTLVGPDTPTGLEEEAPVPVCALPSEPHAQR